MSENILNTFDEQVEQDDRTTARDNLPVFFGSRKETHHPIREQFNNAFDELNENFESGKITATISDDNKEFTIEDTGRGMPLSLQNDKGKPYWELFFRTLFSGGKYGKNIDKNTGGTNGCGNTCTNYCSLFFECTSYFSGEEWFISFKNGGIIDTPLTKIGKTNKHGTKIHFKLDPTVFSIDTTINYDIVKEYATKCLMSFKNIMIELKYKGNTEILSYDDNYFINNSLCEDEFNIPEKSFMSKNSKKLDVKNTFSGNFYYTNKDVFQQTNLNGIWLKDGGSIDKGIIKGIKKYISNYIKINNLLKKNEKNISEDDISSTISFCINVKSSDVEYLGQTKFLTESQTYQDEICQYIQEILEIIKIERKSEFDYMINQILITKRANESAETKRRDTRKQLESGLSNAKTRPLKYVPHNKRSTPKEDIEVILVEGSSALNPIKTSRDASYTAIYPLRGKIINTLKNNLDDILKNQEVKDIFQILGCGVTYNGKKVKGLPMFDIDNLNIGKVLITTDRDVDGGHIESLILALFYKFTPELIKQGKIYILYTPLYIIKYDKKEIFAYTEEERNNIIKELNIKNKKYTEMRFKGVGGLSPKVLSKTAMNKENRVMKRVKWDDVENGIKIINLCMSDEEAVARKIYIENEGYKYFDFSLIAD